jgi:hypothetical protein
MNFQKTQYYDDILLYYMTKFLYPWDDNFLPFYDETC